MHISILNLLSTIMLKSFSPCKAEGMYGINVWIPKELNSFAEHHSMIQIACEATMEDALLDPIFTISHFADSAVNTLPPVGGSDHAAQLIQLRTTFSNKASTKRKVVDYTKLGHVLSQIDWSLCFNNCANVIIIIIIIKIIYFNWKKEAQSPAMDA